MAKILIIGSSNTDMVVKTTRFPQAGETIIGGEFFMFPGGKGANQAVAAARAGGDLRFMAKIGNDIFGQQALEGFRREGIDTQFIIVDEESASGIALITVDARGENEIVVAPGANARLSLPDIDQAQAAIEEAELLLLQLEIPIETVNYIVRKAARAGKKVILNPAPAQPLENELYPHLFLITPNETEIELLTGVRVVDLQSAGKAAELLLDKGVQHVVITLGAQGAFFKSKTEQFHVPARELIALDTTAAGDVFNGVLLVALSNEMTWQAAVQMAVNAASLSVTRMGAQSSAPYLHEITNT